jgi:hypothetical protein
VGIKNNSNFNKIIKVNIATALDCVYTRTLGPILVLSQGIVFLYNVKAGLNTIEHFHERFEGNRNLPRLIKTYTMYLGLLYVYFVDLMVRICINSLFQRFDLDYDSSTTDVLVAIDQTVSNLSVFAICGLFSKKISMDTSLIPIIVARVRNSYRFTRQRYYLGVLVGASQRYSVLIAY